MKFQKKHRHPDTLSSDAGDYLGRKVGMSTVIRALALFAHRQDVSWLYEKVCPFIEAEMQEGLWWGRKKKE